MFEWSVREKVHRRLISESWLDSAAGKFSRWWSFCALLNRIQTQSLATTLCEQLCFFRFVCNCTWQLAAKIKQCLLGSHQLVNPFIFYHIFGFNFLERKFENCRYFYSLRLYLTWTVCAWTSKQVERKRWRESLNGVFEGFSFRCCVATVLRVQYSDVTSRTRD